MKRVGTYLLESVAGKGHLGTVYKSRDENSH